MLSKQSVVVVRDFVLVKIPACLPVNEKTSIRCSAINTNERNLEAVAKTWRRIKAGRGGVLCLRSQIADRRTCMQIPPIHIQFGNVGADLNAGEIFRLTRDASNAAGDRRAKHYFSGSCEPTDADTPATAAAAALVQAGGALNRALCPQVAGQYLRPDGQPAYAAHYLNH